MTEVRSFNEKGKAAFSALIVEKSSDISSQVKELIYDDAYTTSLGFDLDLIEFETRYELAEHLWKSFAPDKPGFPFAGDRNMWTWISAAYLPVLLGNPAKIKLIGEPARWVLEETTLRQHRHLVSGPYVIFRANFPRVEDAMAGLATPILKPGEVVERVAGKTGMFHGAAMAVATELYYDKKSKKLKKNSSTHEAGGPRRLSYFLSQIDLTLDYPVMDKEHLIDLLPEEFNVFLDAKE
jgi:hypothetical protein